MEIKVLGPGCAKCRKLYDEVTQALADEGVEADLEKIESLDGIMSYGIMMTPGLVIDGAVKCAGKVPPREEIARWLRETARG